MLCSLVVEKSTREEIFTTRAPTVTPESAKIEAKCDESAKFHLIWLQRHTVVSDQFLGSFAIFAIGERDSIMISRRSPPPAANPSRAFIERKERQGRAVRKLWQPKVRLELWTLLGVTTSILGFLLQFVGLRQLHWSGPIVLLGATALMTCLRAYVRRSLATEPVTAPIPKDYELDWFATLFAFYDKDLWPEDEKHVPQHNLEWDIIKTIPARGELNMATSTPSRAQRALQIRERLGKLSGWTGPASTVAVCLANATEAVLNMMVQE